jgi:hypothetical protein
MQTVGTIVLVAIGVAIVMYGLHLISERQLERRVNEVERQFYEAEYGASTHQ